MTFSSADRLGISRKLWNTNPTDSLRSAARASSSSCESGFPNRYTSPSLGVSNPASSVISVDFPAPDAPTIATLSPA
ncbi:Uncharacterised protein [Vibrio cholerae]|nr:Uncharacterised protein [Vibrio cholerae]